jgi:hypothetical protein
MYQSDKIILAVLIFLFGVFGLGFPLAHIDLTCLQSSWVSIGLDVGPNSLVLRRIVGQNEGKLPIDQCDEF